MVKKAFYKYTSLEMNPAGDHGINFTPFGLFVQTRDPF